MAFNYGVGQALGTGSSILESAKKYVQSEQEKKQATIQQKPKATIVGLVKPKRTDEATIRNATFEATEEVLKGNNPADYILPKYSNQLDDDGMDIVVKLSSDILNGSGADEVKSAYKQFTISDKTVDELYEGYNLMKQAYGTDSVEGDMQDSVTTIEEPKDIMSGIGTIAGVGLGSVVGLKAASNISKKLGKALYGLAITEPKEIAERIKNAKVSVKETELGIKRLQELKKTEKDANSILDINEKIKNLKKGMQLAKDTMPESTVDVGLRTPGAYGTLENVGVTIEASADDIAKRYINPGLELANENLGKIKTSDVFDTVYKQIENIKKSKGAPYANQLLEAFEDIKKASVGNKKTLTYQEANAIKSGIYDLMTSKEKSGKISTNLASKAKSLIGSAFVNKITEGLKSIDPSGEILKEYKSYGARKLGGQLATSAIKEPGIGGSLGATSAVIKKITSIGGTAAGKALDNLGKALDIPYKTLKGAGVAIGKGLKKLAPTLKTLDPTGMLGEIIMTEIDTQGLSGGQIDNFVKYRFQGMDSAKAAEQAKKLPPESKNTLISI